MPTESNRKTGPEKDRILRQFHLLADFLAAEGKIENGEEYKDNFPAFLSFARHLRSYQIAASFCRSKTVLDIGCFLGYGAKYIAGVAREVIAVDRDQKALDWGKRFWNISGINFARATVPELPFPDCRFDAVLACELIEHLSPGVAGMFFEEVNRVLKPGGFFFLATPNRSFRLLPGQAPFNPEHVREFRAGGISRLLRKNFAGVSVEGINAVPWVKEIEKKRVRQSPLRVYLCRPLLRLAERFFPNPRRFWSISVLGGRRRKNAGIIPPSAFPSFFEKFSPGDYYREKKRPSQSLTLLAFCRKESGE